MGLFFLAPLVLVGWMSLHRWPLLGEPKLNLPDNYTGVADNDLIHDAAWFTAKYTVVITVLLFALAFGLALLTQRRRRGVGFFRTVFILPIGRFRFPGRDVLFLLTLAILMVPYATILTALTRILLHAVPPGLVTVALFAFLVSWNEFFAPLILLNSTDKFTMTLAVVNMRTATHGSIDHAALEAGVVVMAVPCLLLFAFMQRSYVRGFMSGALRG